MRWIDPPIEFSIGHDAERDLVVVHRVEHVLERRKRAQLGIRQQPQDRRLAERARLSLKSHAHTHRLREATTKPFVSFVFLVIFVLNS